MQMVLLFLVLALGLAIGLLVAIGLNRRAAVLHAHSADADREAAIEAAVKAVLSEREVTLHTFRHERDTAVQQAVQIANAQLKTTLDAGTRELDNRSEQLEKHLGVQVAGISTELTKVNDLMSTMQRERARQHGEVVQSIKATAAATNQLGSATQGLRDALANPKARGQWGERMAEDVLRRAGFQEGINFVSQTRATNGTTIPDFTFFLPKQRVIHMDVKFPVDNYVRFLDAGTDAEADAARVAFSKDVRNRIKEIGVRGYIDPETTVDSVLLFIPNESVYSFIHENDAEVVDLALSQKVVLCSPFTLFAVLAVIRESMDNYLMERTGSEILECLTRFNKQWGKFTDQLDKVDKHLVTVNNAFGELSGPRRRQLERELLKIDELQEREAEDPDAFTSLPRLRQVNAS